MKLLYIAGPYRGVSREDVELNIASATQVGKLVARAGHFPVIPHLNTRHFELFGNLPDSFYLEGTMRMLQRCDAVVLCPGWRDSRGAADEVREAKRLRIPVFESVEAFIDSL